MITYESKRSVKISGQLFDVIPFNCIADATGEILFKGHLRVDAEGNPYIFKAEPRMTQKQRTRVIDSYRQQQFQQRTGRPR